MELNDRTRGISGRIVDIINPSLIRRGVYVLVILTGLLFIIELLCHGIIGANPIEGACRHFITLQFIEQATTFLFSLTAFLLVGVVVVSSFIVTETQRLNLDPQEFELVLREGGGNDNNGSQIAITHFEDFVSGEKTSTESGLATWLIASPNHRILSELRNRIERIQISEEPGGLRLGDNRYAVRDIDGEDTDTDIEGKYDYRVKGHVNGEENFPDVLSYPDDENEQARIHWLLREEEAELRAIERQLRRAVTYSVSASVLGVLIQGFPWIVDVASDPWMLGLSFPETVVYIPASYLFTFAFLGMITTSVGLLEVMAELLTRQRDSVS